MGEGYSKLKEGSGRALLNIAPTKTVNQTSLEYRALFDTFLIWVDGNYDPNSADYRHTWMQLHNAVHNLNVFTNNEAAIQFLEKIEEEKIFVLCSGSLGQILVPKIHAMNQVDSIFIFCGNRSYHEEWVKPWRKVKCVFTQIEPICDILRQSVKRVNEDNISMSCCPSDDVGKLDISTIHAQLFKTYLLKITYENGDRQKFVKLCQKILAENPKILHLIEQFDHHYHPKKAIWWYQYLDFPNQILNRAVRLLDVDIIIDMGFFIHDIHQQLEQLHREQFNKKSCKSFTVYRGQRLSKSIFNDLQKNHDGLIIVHNFFSTTKEQSYAKQIAQEAVEQEDTIGVLFNISVDPSTTDMIFSDIRKHRGPENRTDIIFGMHTVFQIVQIIALDHDSRLFSVQLIPLPNSNSKLPLLIGRIEQEIAGRTERESLCNLLIQVGHYEKAEECYLDLLEQALSGIDQIRYYEQLVRINDLRKNQEREIFYHEKILHLQQKSLPVNHPSLALINYTIGLKYYNIGDYVKAQCYFEKALQIQWNILPLDHPDLLPIYDHLAAVYNKMSLFSKALSFYRRAITLKEKILPNNDSDLVADHMNIGSVYNAIQEYAEALLHYEKALEIQQKILTPDDPDLAAVYDMIGTVYLCMRESWKALTYFNRAVEIKRKHLPGNHPDLAKSYSEMGKAYFEMNEYSKAIESFQAALNVYENCSPPVVSDKQYVSAWIERVKKTEENRITIELVSVEKE